MQLCVFEDKKATNFLPITYSRPVYDLICGYTSLKDKILRIFPSFKYSLHCRAYLKNVVSQYNPGIQVNSFEGDEILFINGRALIDDSLTKILKKKRENVVFVSGDTVVAVHLSGSKLESLKNNINDFIDIENFEGITVEEIRTKTFNYIWDLINYNNEELNNEFEFQFNKRKKKSQKKISGKIYEGVYLVGKKEIIIEKGTVVKPGVVIDASKGSVYIDKNVEIFPNAVIEGPAYIGESSKIKSAATIYENVSIGRVCKVGGEVEGSIIMPYSNKQHAGFLGHTYLGSWVNLGADTNNSDLKNNYSTVKIYINGKMVDSGSQFMGLIMGDHSKSAINTMFNTGAIIGFSCNIFGAGFPDKFVPYFTWGGIGKSKVYDVFKSIETATTAMSRRNIIMSEDEKKLFQKIFELTALERNTISV